MRDAFKSFRVNIAKEGEEPVLVWSKYKDKNMRNEAKAYRRRRKVAGTASEPAPRRMRYYRPIGRNGKVTRLEKLQAEYQRETRFQAEHQQETEALQMQQEVADGHVHDENCNHDHV